MDIEPAGSPIPHSSHWGAFSVLRGAEGVTIVPHPRDPDPASLLGNLPAALTHKARIATPMVRRGWLERGPGPDRQRGREDFVAISWPEALDLASAELRRVYAAEACSADRMAGPAPDGFITPKARSIAS